MGCQPGRCVFPEQETGLLLLSPQGRIKRNAVEPPHYKKRIRERIIFLSTTARQSPDCDLIEPFRSISVLNIVSKKCPGRLST